MIHDNNFCEPGFSTAARVPGSNAGARPGSKSHRLRIAAPPVLETGRTASAARAVDALLPPLAHVEHNAPFSLFCFYSFPTLPPPPLIFLLLLLFRIFLV